MKRLNLNRPVKSNAKKILVATIAYVVFLAISVTITIILIKMPSSPLPEFDYETEVKSAELLDLAEGYLLDLDCAKALVYFGALIEHDPTNPRGYTGAAESYAVLGELREAENTLRQGLAVLPENAEITKAMSTLEAMMHLSFEEP